MRHLLDLPTPVLVGLGACVLAVGVIVYLIISPGPVQLSLSRRRPGAAPQVSLLTRAAGAATRVLDRFLSRRGSTASTAALLELAGIKMRPQDFFLLIIAAVLGATALGALLSGLLLAIVFAVLVPVVVKVVISIKTGRRQRAFDGQLDDALQMLAGSLRAGHSLLQALDTVAQEAPAPLSEEFTRVINETRVGRDLTQALEEIAVRMDSKDMVWVGQAITINRNVGGNLAEVLDQVSGTIRERGQIKRQVKTLAAEGKLSAYVLMALPFGVAGFIWLTNPAYIMKLTESLVGYAMIGAAALLLVFGGLWLRKVTAIKF
jgi:tight adherence protein B